MRYAIVFWFQVIKANRWRNFPLEDALARGTPDFIWYLARIHVDFVAGGCTFLGSSLHNATDKAREAAENTETKSKNDVKVGGDGSTEVPQLLKESPGLLELLESRVGQPRPLLQQVMDSLRTHFRQHCLPFHSMQLLPLPAYLTSKLLYDV